MDMYLFYVRQEQTCQTFWCTWDLKEWKRIALKVEVVQTEHEFSPLIKSYSTNRRFREHFYPPLSHRIYFKILM
jgi:hypothetical protein